MYFCSSSLNRMCISLDSQSSITGYCLLWCHWFIWFGLPIGFLCLHVTKTVLTLIITRVRGAFIKVCLGFLVNAAAFWFSFVHMLIVYCVLSPFDNFLGLRLFQFDYNLSKWVSLKEREQEKWLSERTPSIKKEKKKPCCNNNKPGFKELQSVLE